MKLKNIRLTVGQKLNAGFAIIVALLIVVSGITYTQVRRVAHEQDTLVNRDIPTEVKALELRGHIHAALSAHRGYIILGLEELKTERADIWKQIDAETEELIHLVTEAGDEHAIQTMAELQTTLKDFAASQAKIVAIAHERENTPATVLFEDEALPYGKKMQKHLEAIMDAEDLEPTTAERKLMVHHVGNAEAHLLKVTAALTQYLIDGNEEQLSVLNGEIAACARSVEKLKKDVHLFTPAQRADFDAYISHRNEFLAVAGKVIETRSADDWNIAQYICGGTVTPLAIKADGLIGEIAHQSTETAEAHIDSLITRSNFVQTMMISLSLLTVIAAIGIAWFLRRTICPPLSRTAEAVQRIADGDLTARVDIRSNDEVGDLGRNFNEMAQSISKIINEVNCTVSEVAAAATEIAATSEQISTGMNEQSSQVTQISAAVEEMSASVIEVARKSAEASNNAEQSGQAASEGGEVVDQTINEINAIREAVDASSKSVAELGKRGEQIGEIIEVINDIADQTNLLALNAAIEAARAGEHGRGFAVVADEVRKLADRTTQATEEIGASIQAIQSETTSAVERMNTGSQQVESGVAKATDAGRSLTQIVSNAREVAGMIQSIAAATEEQSATSEEVARNVENIASVIQESNDGTRQAAVAAQQLSERAERLQGLVCKFKVDPKMVEQG
ncbi:methyl-accepting chemotaxis protein [Algisphaera agarilytica]|uniref:Methyl-accepting chemotaxis protein n=1 Tax=Algisphaera agarilytica TaxID=1385975 RepID=A0A7X0H3F3_9BACT|nr:methyl-accepting chemotaxis protein [Algisphaera agarilytica]MBB6428510.1 methyl-accepting chemotaxis protein [Algisphaera agarilytica]